MSERQESVSDVTVRVVWSRSGEGPAQIVEAVDLLLERLESVVPGLVWEIPFAGAWSGSVQERQRLVGTRTAGDVNERAVPERGGAFSLTAANDALRWHGLVAAGAPVSGSRIPMQRASMRMVTTDGSGIGQELVSAVIAAMVSAWRPSMAVATSRDLALADPVNGWEIPTGYQLWLAGPGLENPAGSTITAQHVGAGTLLTAAPDAETDTIVADMRHALTDAGLVQIPH